jgi:fructose-1,6-bisphosphatase/sedoheptulose 1,7-bisphosphatase-like protein
MNGKACAGTGGRYTLLYSHARAMRARSTHTEKRMKKEERRKKKERTERIKRMGIAGEKDKWREDLL